MGLDSVDHVVVLMLENRSFDHMLGYLYTAHGNKSLSGQDFDGLTGTESNPDASGNQVPVAQITSQTPNAYWMPLCNPGEGYQNTNQQLFGIDPTAQPPEPPVATNQGFVQSFATVIQAAAGTAEPPWPGAEPASIMGMHTPETLPVLSALAQGFAVCDRWFASAPTETIPNRAFALAGTSQGHLTDDEDDVYTCGSIYGALTTAGVSWRVYGYTKAPYTQMDFPDTRSAPAANFGLFADFQQQAADGTLPAFGFLEPEWGNRGNSQHPAYNVAAGEALISEVYRACRDGQNWDSTLLVLTYDEHGGCYDHVPPPQGAAPPDANPPTADFDFDFTRFGVRVPTVLVSPLIAPGTVYRAPDGGPPHDHTSLLATVEKRWDLQPLTQRDAAAPDIGSALTLDQPRTDDPLAGIQPPAVIPVTDAAGARIQQDDTPSHIQEVYASLAARLPIPQAAGAVPADAVNTLTTGTQHADFIESRLQTWNNIKANRT
jgi:phospholipase C